MQGYILLEQRKGKHILFKSWDGHQYLIRDWPGNELIGAALINCNNMDREQWPLGSKFPPWDVSSKVIISALSLSGQCKANTPRSVGCIDSVCQWPNAVASPDQDERSGHLSWTQYYFMLFLGMSGPPLTKNGYLWMCDLCHLMTPDLDTLFMSDVGQQLTWHSGSEQNIEWSLDNAG